MAKRQNRDAEPQKTRDGEGRRVCPACNEPIAAGAATVPLKPQPVHKDCWDRIRNGTARLETD